MKRAALAALGVLLGCSGLTETSGGIVGIEVTVPRDTVIVGDSLHLSARALDKNSDSVATTIFWATPDTATIKVDSATGVVTGLHAGIGRVQAVSPAIASALVSIVVIDTTTPTTPSSTEVVRPRR